jgi:hypothetical protein
VSYVQEIGERGKKNIWLKLKKLKIEAKTNILLNLVSWASMD